MNAILIFSNYCFNGTEREIVALRKNTCENERRNYSDAERHRREHFPEPMQLVFLGDIYKFNESSHIVGYSYVTGSHFGKICIINY